MTFPTEAKPRRIFISYRHVEPDQSIAVRLASELEKQHEVFIDTNLQGGDVWPDLINRGLAQADFLVVLLSSATSGQGGDKVMGEVELAHYHERNTGRPLIVPVRLGMEGPLPYPLNAYVNRFHYLFWNGPKNTESLVLELTRVVGERARSSPYAAANLPIEASYLMQLRRLAKRVRYTWFQNTAHDTLLADAGISLELVRRPDMVQRSTEGSRGPMERAEPLANSQEILQVFEDHLGQLLITGPAGGGKTTILLELARELLERWELHHSEGVPVILKLSSWGIRRPRLDNWLVDELASRYDVPRRLGTHWVANDLIVPLLDGLDEVAEANRDACISAINAFRKDHGLASIAVCTRTREYKQLSERLRLPAAISIEPLSVARVQEVLSRSEALAGLGAALSNDEGLVPLFNTPLMLVIGARVYTNKQDLMLKSWMSVPEFRSALFQTYIDIMIGWRPSMRFTKDRMMGYLTALASGMSATQQSVFQFEDLSLHWLAQGQRWFLRSAGAILIGLTAAAACDFAYGLFVLILQQITPRWAVHGSKLTVATTILVFALCSLMGR